MANFPKESGRFAIENVNQANSNDQLTFIWVPSVEYEGWGFIRAEGRESAVHRVGDDIQMIAFTDTVQNWDALWGWDEENKNFYDPSGNVLWGSVGDNRFYVGKSSEINTEYRPMPAKKSNVK